MKMQRIHTIDKNKIHNEILITIDYNFINSI